MSSTIKIVRHASPRSFRARAEAWLLQHEAEHNLILGLCSQLEHSMTGYEPPVYFATIERDNTILGCAFRTPPYGLGITHMPDEALAPLLADVADVYHVLPGVLGPDPEAAKLAHSWSVLRGGNPREGMRERIYKLERVLEPERTPPGHPRTATEADMSIVLHWADAFSMEVGIPLSKDRFQELVKTGRILLWDDDGARTMAGCSGDTPNGSRVGYVYTPPDWRGQGYASACVAALSRQIIGAGRQFCFLYTDLANPTSNSIYQRIGYEPVCDVVEYRIELATTGRIV